MEAAFASVSAHSAAILARHRSQPTRSMQQVQDAVDALVRVESVNAVTTTTTTIELPPSHQMPAAGAVKALEQNGADYSAIERRILAWMLCSSEPTVPTVSDSYLTATPELAAYLGIEQNPRRWFDLFGGAAGLRQIMVGNHEPAPESPYATLVLGDTHAAGVPNV